MQLCCVLVTEVWPVLWVCGTAEAPAGDANGGFGSLQGAGSAGDVCQAPFLHVLQSIA